MSKGEHRIRYRASLKNNPGVFTYLEKPFIVKILEPPSQSKYSIKVEPEWLINLEDQYITVGEYLLYEFIVPDSQQNLKVDLQRISRFARFDYKTNSLIVQGDSVTRVDVGTW